jgi:metallo-beta-lactamase class B
VFLVRAVLVAAATIAQSASPLTPDPAIRCSDCDAWNKPIAPFRLFGNSYYVGTEGLSAILVTSDEGHVLLDGALPQSAPVIEANIRTLGFRLADVRLIVNSHAHFDHAGGINALQRASGAVVGASPSGVEALRTGMPVPDDPQYSLKQGFPAVSNTRAIAANETVRVGPIALTAHHTPGHTPGSTAWTWQSCEGSRCLSMVYADSLTPVSAGGFRFSGGAGRPSLLDTFRASIAKVERLPCDIVVSTHPQFTGLTRKLEQKNRDASVNPFIDPDGCRAYAAEARKRLEQRIAEERK